MPESVGSLKPGQLQEIKKWRDMGFNGNQISKKTGIRQPLVSVTLKYLKENK